MGQIDESEHSIIFSRRQRQATVTTVSDIIEGVAEISDSDSHQLDLSESNSLPLSQRVVKVDWEKFPWTSNPLPP